jgi:hypothetical protein
MTPEQAGMARFLAWPVVALAFRRRRLGLGQFLGSLDMNLTSAIQRSVVRPFFDSPTT